MSHTKEPFKREERYIVIKIKDLKYISVENKLRRVLAEAGIPTRECVVVEVDWPEFDLVWSMIEARMTGTGNDHRRVVACVNTLAGFTIEEIEAGVDLVKFKQQRDELLAALQWYADRYSNENGKPTVAQKAIAKVKEQK